MADRNRRPNWTVLIWLGVAVGAALRFVGLGTKSLWFDEGYTAWVVSHPAREILRLVGADTAPPLYYLLLRGWTNLFGHSEAGLRSMSAVISALTLVLMVGIARRMLVKPPAIAAAVWLLVLGFHQQYFAQEARAYALMALLVVAMLDCLQRHLAAQHRGWLGIIVLIAAASLYTHNTMAFYLVALAPAWLLLPSAHSLNRRLIDGAIVAIAVIVLFLPWAITSLPSQVQLVNASFWPEPVSLKYVLMILDWITGVPPPDDWNALLYMLHSPHGIGPVPLWFGLILVLAAAIVSIGWQPPSGKGQILALLALMGVAPLGITVYSILSTPILMDKIFLPSATLMPVFLLIPLAMNLGESWRVRLRAWTAIIFVIAGATLIQYFTTTQKEDWRGAAALVQALPPEPRLIIFVANDGQLPFDFYYHYRPEEWATGVPSGFFDIDPPRTMLRVKSPDDLRGLQALIERYYEVVLVQCHEGWGDPNGQVLHMLRENFAGEHRTDFYYVTVFRFDR